MPRNARSVPPRRPGRRHVWVCQRCRQEVRATPARFIEQVRYRREDGHEEIGHVVTRHLCRDCAETELRGRQGGSKPTATQETLL